MNISNNKIPTDITPEEQFWIERALEHHKLDPINSSKSIDHINRLLTEIQKKRDNGNYELKGLTLDENRVLVNALVSISEEANVAEESKIVDKLILLLINAR